MDGVTSQSFMSVDGGKIREKALEKIGRAPAVMLTGEGTRKKVMLESLPESRKIGNG